ncbi:hypothetical protein [Bosea sp. PAMC 26642]|uniref:hypothetical protein n=1 Tax=Bosea sp. (strain PAMC 26642) TaxID=1792307 RepID=UPI0012E992A5|nr:hypothetical protein [Bosea sp. PAMC 26642]
MADVQYDNFQERLDLYSSRDLTHKLGELVSKSKDGLTTFGDLWYAFFPDVKWKHHTSRYLIKKTLGRVGEYCSINNYPLLNVMVVSAKNRKHPDRAVGNIFAAAKEWRLETGLNADAFVNLQMAKCKGIDWEKLPDDKVSTDTEKNA